MNGVLPEHPTEEQHIAVDNIGLAVVGQDLRVVGVPVGAGQFKWDILNELLTENRPNM